MGDALVMGVRSGDARSVARALTVVENDPDAAARLLAALSGGASGPSGGGAHRVGITGPPGAGKSTLVTALVRGWRAAGRRVGVLAVDPTSPFSGGALLGDRVRMSGLSGDSGVFIRSFATRGELGGLSRAVHDAADVLEAAGFDPVVIETVGVGQSEVAIAAAADTVIVVLAPGSGDSVQAMKAGLVEAADILVVNQADRPGAEGLASDLAAAVELQAAGRKAPVLQTVATTGLGVEALRAEVDLRRPVDPGPGAADERRKGRARHRIQHEVDRRRHLAFWGPRTADLDRLVEDVVGGRMTVAGAAGTLLGDPSPGAPPAP